MRLTPGLYLKTLYAYNSSHIATGYIDCHSPSFSDEPKICGQAESVNFNIESSNCTLYWQK